MAAIDERRRRPAAVADVPRRRALTQLDLERLLPSARVLLVGLGIVASAAALYVAARETSLFALRTVEVKGAPPEVAARVRAALAPFAGTSLAALPLDDVRRRVAALPVVAGATYDRVFPHTLRVVVRAERPLAVLRDGTSSWLVSHRARVLARVRHRTKLGLPRIWARTRTARLGATLTGRPAEAATVLARIAPTGFLRRVRSVHVRGEDTTVTLRRGPELRLGLARDVPLKIAIARKLLAGLPAAAQARYVDLSVPERPLVGS